MLDSDERIGICQFLQLFLVHIPFWINFDQIINQYVFKKSRLINKNLLK